jgi:hypothetical protein
LARRFSFLTDVHISDELVEALRANGYPVVRVVDEKALGQRALDAQILAFAVEHGYVWLTRDERAQLELGQRRARGEALPGVVCWSQRYRRTMSIGDVLKAIEALAEEREPFLQGMRYLKPSGA